MQKLRPRSKSTNVPSGQICRRRASRVTTACGCATSSESTRGRLRLQPYRDAFTTEIARGGVELEQAEPDAGSGAQSSPLCARRNRQQDVQTDRYTTANCSSDRSYAALARPARVAARAADRRVRLPEGGLDQGGGHGWIRDGRRARRVAPRRRRRAHATGHAGHDPEEPHSIPRDANARGSCRGATTRGAPAARTSTGERDPRCRRPHHRPAAAPAPLSSIAPTQAPPSGAQPPIAPVQIAPSSPRSPRAGTTPPATTHNTYRAGGFSKRGCVRAHARGRYATSRGRAPVGRWAMVLAARLDTALASDDSEVDDDVEATFAESRGRRWTAARACGYDRQRHRHRIRQER